MRRAEREASTARSNEDSYVAHFYRVRQAERQNRPSSSRQDASLSRRHDVNALSHDIPTIERSQAGEEILRDALQYERPGQRLRRRQQPRESALRFEVDSETPANGSTLQQGNPRAQIPSPPYSSNGSSLPAPPSLRRTPPLTVGFAPAFPISSHGGSRIPTPPSGDHADRLEASRIPTPPGQHSLDSWPPLRRTTALVHDRALDGESSDSDMEGDRWETLLTTIEPDEHLPSANSSFASATASFSTSRSEQSLRSTAPSSVDPQAPLDGPLDASYCPQSPSSSEDDPSGDESRTPVPPHELIQAMNRRAEAAARSRDLERNVRPRILDSWRVFHQGQADDSRSAAENGNGLFIPEQRSRAQGITQHSNNSSAHLPVLAGDDLHASLRPIDGPVDVLPRLLANTASRNTSTSPLDDEINHELQRYAELDRIRERFIVRTVHPDRAQRITSTVRSTPGGDTPSQAAESGHASQALPSSHSTNEAPIARDILSPDREIEASDLPSMQRIIQRMTTREDIPDDWWAAVGLRRSFEV